MLHRRRGKKKVKTRKGKPWFYHVLPSKNIFFQLVFLVFLESNPNKGRLFGALTLYLCFWSLRVQKVSMIFHGTLLIIGFLLGLLASFLGGYRKPLKFRGSKSRPFLGPLSSTPVFQGAWVGPHQPHSTSNTQPLPPLPAAVRNLFRCLEIQGWINDSIPTNHLSILNQFCSNNSMFFVLDTFLPPKKKKNLAPRIQNMILIDTSQVFHDIFRVCSAHGCPVVVQNRC